MGLALSSTEDTLLGLGEGWHLVRAWWRRRTHPFRLSLCSHQYDTYVDITGKIPKRVWEPTNNYEAAILHASLSLRCPPTRCEFCGWCPALFTRGLNQTWHRICTAEGKAWFRGRRRSHIQCPGCRRGALCVQQIFQKPGWRLSHWLCNANRLFTEDAWIQMSSVTMKDIRKQKGRCEKDNRRTETSAV